MSHIIGVRKNADLQNGVREAKSLGNPELNDNFDEAVFQHSAGVKERRCLNKISLA